MNRINKMNGVQFVVLAAIQAQIKIIKIYQNTIKIVKLQNWGSGIVSEDSNKWS